MREWDIYNEIIALGKRRGTLTYDEINDAFPSEFFSPDEMEDFMDLLQDMGVKVIDNQEHATDGEEWLAGEEEKSMNRQKILSRHISIRWGTFRYLRGKKNKSSQRR